MGRGIWQRSQRSEEEGCSFNVLPQFESVHSVDSMYFFGSELALRESIMEFVRGTQSLELLNQIDETVVFVD